MSFRKSFKRAAILTAIFVVAILAGTSYFAPTLAATACPACYGLERAGENLFVEKKMLPRRRDEVRALVAAAEIQVASFYGSRGLTPIVLTCETETCDHRLGGRGARAVTYSAWNFAAVRVSPRGLSKTILAHEFSHVELHHRIGTVKFLRTAIPAWFDEGLAVLVSEDERYLRPGENSSARCTVTPRGELPVSPFEWGPLAGRTPGMYADAACRVMNWMEANGGKSGLLAAVDEVARGDRRLP